MFGEYGGHSIRMVSRESGHPKIAAESDVVWLVHGPDVYLVILVS